MAVDESGTLQEKQKRVFSKRIAPAMVQFAVFQLPSIAATVVLFGLYFMEFTWNPSTGQLNALLFAAKVHESLIIASLFNILHYHIRRGLLSADGVPFGYLTSSFQLNSPFYLLSSSFLAPLIKSRPASWSSAGLGILLVVTFVLAALAGASSGVAILPRQTWRPLSVAADMGLNSGSFQAFVVSPARDLYPSFVDLSTVPDACTPRLALDNASKDGCPFIHYQNPESTAYAWLKDIKTLPRTTNLAISYPELKSIAYLGTTNPRLDPGKIAPVAVATCPSARITGMLSEQAADWARFPQSYNPGRLFATVSDQGGARAPLKQPRVAIQCADIKGDNQNSSFPDLYSWSFDPGVYPKFILSMKKSFIDDAAASGKRFGFIDVQDQLPESIKASTAFWVNPYRVGICLIDARWVESNVWINPSETANVPQHTVPVDDAIGGQYQHDFDELITLDLSWLGILNASLQQSNNAGAYNYYNYNASNATHVFDFLAGHFHADGDLENRSDQANRDFQGQLAGALAVYLTDALSLVPFRYHAWSLESTQPHGPWRLTSNDENYSAYTSNRGYEYDHARVEVWHYHNTYAYTFGETTLILVWVVLLAHVLLVVVHWFTILINEEWSSGAWSQLGELMSLSMNSSPTQLLKNTGAGTGSWHTWRLKVFVREVESDGKVELVLVDTSDSDALKEVLGEKPKADRVYG
ncbi:hypothetical protein B0T22DRAFT_481689 [Podospora appendiculata]|uniref:Uncharacterized protein n=1 Tax=Podospora appendiculata TaxID=314037 RepID=A0AAE0XD37_9PEZI|nr:hypothetical protein B0T22DRAFT_481689 [Podospora appendiculata]